MQEPSPAPIISIQNLSHSFGDKPVLSNINLTIRRGEFITILGPSGCGKTTLMRLIAGFLKAGEGKIVISGKDMTHTPPHLRPVNTVFQKYALFPHLNVFKNIAFGLQLKKLPPAEIENRVNKVLKMVTMADYEEREVDSLSGGQQQRVAIARAIVNEPDVLLLDEPLAALDLKMRKDMQLEIMSMHKKLNITFIYITHDQEEALTLSDTIVVMRDGQIQQIGTPTEIYNEPANSWVADFIGESNILNGTMIEDELVEFAGKQIECVDRGFGTNEPVDVVIRPEDIYIFEVSDAAQFTGRVTSCIFKGVHYEMMVTTAEGFEMMIQDYHAFEPGKTVGLRIKPSDIHVMRKERLCNTFTGTISGDEHVSIFGTDVECGQAANFSPGQEVKVLTGFDEVILFDDPGDGLFPGVISFILFKGDHFHLTVTTPNYGNVYVNTTDVWDDGDRIGLGFAPGSLKIEPV
jgi:spermidine/putrescine transport system ATP-binding protein